MPSERSATPGFMKNCLENCRVLDLSRVFSGPWAAQMLGDLGAEVVKVERPGSGDDSRRLGPYFTHPERGSAESVFFASANRNKKSITVDISSEQGQALIRAMAAKSDVLIENYKVGTLQRYGLDYASLARINPALVYCSITGFGQTGPLSKRPGYDLVFQAMSGLMSVTGSEGQRRRTAAGRICRFRFHRRHVCGDIDPCRAAATGPASGVGQHIDLSLLDTQVAALSHIASNYLMTGNIPVRHGTGAPQGTPSQLYRCADREIVVVVGNEGQFASLCSVIGLADLAVDKRFCSNSQRLAHKTELNAIIQGVLLTRDADEWLARLERAKVPAGPVLDMEGVFGHPQIHNRGMRIEPGKTDGGHLAHIANPMKFSASPVEYLSGRARHRRAHRRSAGRLAGPAAGRDRPAARIEHDLEARTVDPLIIEARVNEYATRNRTRTCHGCRARSRAMPPHVSKPAPASSTFTAGMPSGAPDNRFETCRDTILAVRERSPILVHPSLGYLTVASSFEERFANTQRLASDPATRPDFVPMDMGSVNADLFDARTPAFRSPGTVYINRTDMLLALSQRLRQAEIKPSLVAWNVSFIRQIEAFAAMSLLDAPLFVSLVLTDRI